MEYYVNYDPVREEITNYWHWKDLVIKMKESQIDIVLNGVLSPESKNLPNLHIYMDKVYHINDTTILKKLNPEETIEVLYTITLRKIQNQLQELLREEKLTKLLNQ